MHQQLKTKIRSVCRKQGSSAALGLLWGGILLLGFCIPRVSYGLTRPLLFEREVFSERWMQLNELEKQAMKYFLAGQYTTLRSWIEEKLLLKYPRSFVGRFCLAYVLRHQEGELVRSLLFLRQSMVLYKIYARARVRAQIYGKTYHVMLVERIRILRQLGRAQEALEAIQKHERLYKRNALRLEYMKPWTLMKLRRYDQAERLAKSFLRKKKYITTALNALCAITFERGDRLGSLHYCKKAFDADVKLQSLDRTTHRMNLAEAYLGVLRFSKAERYALESTRFFFPSVHANPWELLTHLYLEQGQLNKAFNALRRSNSWKKRQLPQLKESLFGSQQLTQAHFWLTVGDVDNTLKAIEPVLDRPDRHGHTSAQKRQQNVGMHLALRQAYGIKLEVLREQAVTLGWWGWFGNIWQRWRISAARSKSTSSARRRFVRDLRFLQDSLSPYHAGGATLYSGGATMPYVHVGEVIATVGAGVARQQIGTLRQREQAKVPGLKAFFDAAEAEARMQQGDHLGVLRYTQQALKGLPKSLTPLRAWMWALRGKIFFWQGRKRLMLENFALVLQKDSSLFRRLGLRLPVRVRFEGGDSAKKLSRWLLASPRFKADNKGFYLWITRSKKNFEIRLSTVAGSSLADATVRQRKKESERAFLRRAYARVHQSFFAKHLQFSRRDASSLDDSLLGTSSKKIPWKRLLK